MTDKTPLQIAIADAYQKKFDTDVIAFGGSGQFKKNVSKLTDEQIVVLLRYGKRKFNDMWNGSQEKKDGKNVQTYWSNWLETMVEGKAKGSRQSPTEKAWIAFFGAIDHKEGGSAVNGKTLERAQKTLCRRALIAATDPGSPERTEIENNTNKVLGEKLADWITHEEENNPVLKMGIDYQTMLAAQKSMS